MNSYIKTDGNHNVIELQLNVLVFQEGDFYVSYCPSLGLSSYGDSIQDAKDGFDEAMRGYIADCESYKSIHDDLISRGWIFTQGRNNKVEPPAQVELNIPAGVLKKQFNENWSVPVC